MNEYRSELMKEAEQKMINEWYKVSDMKRAAMANSIEDFGSIPMPLDMVTLMDSPLPVFDPALHAVKRGTDPHVYRPNIVAEKQYQIHNVDRFDDGDLEWAISPTTPINLFAKMEEKPWVEEYKTTLMNGNGSKGNKRKSKRLSKSMFSGTVFDVNKLLSLYEKIEQKDIGNIAITGSLALFLQGKIKRDTFSDLDLIVVSGTVQLDDEFEDVAIDTIDYAERGALVASPTIYYIDKVLVDIFPSSDCNIEYIDVSYMGKIYPCMNYKNILDAKLKMILPRMKDYQDLYNNVFTLNFL